MSLIIDIIRDTKDNNLPNDDALTLWANLASEGQHDGDELCIRIVSPEESQQLNRDYRGKDKPTNVLSFPFDPPPGVPVQILGDLAICAEVVAREAQEQSKPLEHHWAHMVIHGTLHLRGFDHINDEDAGVMEALERKLLAQINIPDPYADD